MHALLTDLACDLPLGAFNAASVEIRSRVWITDAGRRAIEPTTASPWLVVDGNTMAEDQLPALPSSEGHNQDRDERQAESNGQRTARSIAIAIVEAERL